MPTLTLGDGSTVTWDAAPQEAPAAAETAMVASMPAAVPEAVPEAPTTPTEADVQSALASAPPKWVATATRFGKALAASLAVTFAAYGGDLQKMLADPVGVLTSFGTAAVLAAEKFIHWKD